MATETTERPDIIPEISEEQEALPVRRKGPMSPEEMIDVRNQELRMDEAMVVRLVEEAKADYGVNLLEPHQLYVGGFERVRAFLRHRRRFLQVMGAGAKFKTNGMFILMSLGLGILIFTGLYFEDTHPWGFDAVVSLAFFALASGGIYAFGGYQQVYAKLYALERRDFTDPGYVTGWVRIWVARLAFYFRPDVWRGNDGHNGIGNPDSVIVVACGQDRITWLYDEANPPALDDPLWDAEVWCEVEPGRPLTDFRTPADYYDLPADTYMMDGTGSQHWRSWCRDLLKSGAAYAAWEKGTLAVMDGRWPWIVIVGMFAIGVIAFFMAVG